MKIDRAHPSPLFVSPCWHHAVAGADTHTHTQIHMCNQTGGVRGGKGSDTGRCITTSKNKTQVSSTSNTNSKRTRFCRRPRAAAMLPHHAPTVTCNSQSVGQSVRPVMQSPLQQLSAGSLRVNLFIVVQTVGERSRGTGVGDVPRPGDTGTQTGHGKC